MSLTHSRDFLSVCPVHTHGPFLSTCSSLRRLFTGRSPDCHLCSAVCFTSRSLDCSLVHCHLPFVHRSVAGLLPCSLSLTASSQLKPFVFCVAVCSPVGRRTVIHLLLSLQMPGTHSTGQLLLWLVYGRGLRLLLIHSLTHFFTDGVAVLFCCLILVTTGSFFLWHSSQPCRSCYLVD